MRFFFGGIILFFSGSFCYAVTTYYASQLGCSATLPVTDPTGTVVILDQNLIISSTCPLTLTGNAGNLTFTATGGQQLIIQTSCQWNILSLQMPNTIIFEGSAQLIMQPGASILADQITGAALRFQDATIWSLTS